MVLCGDIKVIYDLSLKMIQGLSLLSSLGCRFMFDRQLSLWMSKIMKIVDGYFLPKWWATSQSLSQGMTFALPSSLFSHVQSVLPIYFTSLMHPLHVITSSLGFSWLDYLTFSLWTSDVDFLSIVFWKIYKTKCGK